MIIAAIAILVFALAMTFDLLPTASDLRDFFDRRSTEIPLGQQGPPPGWLNEGGVDMGPAFADNQEAIKRIDSELNRIEWERLTSTGQGMRAPLLDIYDHQTVNEVRSGRSPLEYDKSYPHGNWDPGQ